MRRKSLLLSFCLIIFLAVGFTALPTADHAPSAKTEWTVDGAHTQVLFDVTHLMITTVTGQFHDFEVELSFDPEDLSTLETEATVQVESIDTGIERRDNHLRSEDFFYAEEYPAMTFVSTDVQEVDGKEFALAGDLTMRGITHPVVFDCEMRGPVTNRGRQRAAFSCETAIDRFDYNLNWNSLMEAGGAVVGNEVDITLQVEAVREAQ